MLSDLTSADAEYLLSRPEFRRFLFLAIQRAGIIEQNPLADGRQGRDLSIAEGRRSLGFELLQLADLGQPEPLRSAHALATLDAVIREAMNPPPKEKTRDRRDRYDELSPGS